MATKRQMLKLLSECLAAIEHDSRQSNLFRRILAVMPNNKPRLSISQHSLANHLIELIYLLYDNKEIDKLIQEDEHISDAITRICLHLKLFIDQDGKIFRKNLEDGSVVNEPALFVEDDFE